MSAVEKAEKGALTLNILGREFRVACPDGEEKVLLASADYLNRRLKEVRDTGKVTGNERIAVMAALNIAHDLLRARRGARADAAVGETPIDGDAARRRIQAMQAVIDQTMAGQEKLF